MILLHPREQTYRNIVAEMAANGTPFADAAAEIAFRTWFQTAWIDSGCTQNFLVLSQPASSTAIQIDVRVAAAGHKVNVWWGDGTSNSYSPTSSETTPCARTYASGALRAVVVLGRITWFLSEYGDGRASFGGRISTLTSLTRIIVYGSNTLSGSVSALKSLTILDVYGSNTLTGSVSALTSLTVLAVSGSNTLSGSVASLTSLTYLAVSGSNTLTGSVSALTSLTLIVVAGSNTLSGSVAALKSLTILSVYGSNTLSGSVAALTSLTLLAVAGSNTLSGFGTLAALATGFCYLSQGGLTVLDATEVNAVLAGFWANRDAAKPLAERVIDIGKDTPTPNAAPTGQGITDRDALRLYRSPNPPGTDALWTVTTN